MTSFLFNKHSRLSYNELQFVSAMASGVVREVISSVIEDESIIDSSRAKEMKVFRQMLVATVGENYEKLDQFDDFCVGYVSEIDHLFSNLPKTIRSSTTKRTRAWRVFHHKRGQNLPKLWEDFF